MGGNIRLSRVLDFNKLIGMGIAGYMRLVVIVEWKNIIYILLYAWCVMNGA